MISLPYFSLLIDLSLLINSFILIYLYQNLSSDTVLLSSQSVVPLDSVLVSEVESSNLIQKDHEVIVTSATQSTEIPSTKGFYLNCGLPF